jgi:serine protease
MKKLSLFLTLFLGFALVFAFAGIKEGKVIKTDGKPVLVEDEVIVAFAPSVTETAKTDFRTKFDLTFKKNSKKAGKFTVFKHKNPKAILAQLKNEPGVLYAEQNVIRYAVWTPNDPYYSYQWHMTRIGMEDAWPLATGSGATVAIIDTGVKQSLEDLASTNFTAGYDFVNGDSDPTDDHGHGSHVAGTVAQSTNNSVGVTGIAYNATIMPLKVLNASGSGSDSDIADAIYWATDNGADIINMSLGSSSSSSTMQNACTYAWNNGVVVVCAAGNSSTSSPFYPAAYTVCISVSAVNYLDQLADYSNYGSTIDICAPGGDSNDNNGDGYMDGVLQNTFGTSGDGYYFYTGTSMASPHVAGVAALVKSVDYSLTNSEVRGILESTAEDIGSAGWDQYFGYGLVDAYAAVVEAQSEPDITPPVISDVAATDITSNSATITWTTDEPADSVVYYGLTTSYGYTESNSANVTAHSVPLSGLSADTLYHYKVSSTDPSDNYAESGDYTFTTEESGGETYMYVYNIQMELWTIWNWLYWAESYITIKDTTGAVVPSATVYIQWSGSVGGTDSATTNSSGVAWFESDWTWGQGTYTITVTNVTHATLTYNSSLNVETSDTI